MRRTTTWVEDITEEPISWAVPDYIPRRIVTSIYGPRNAGKTQVAVWLTAETSKGVTGTKLRVWFNSQEDDLPTVLKPRLSAAGVNLNPETHQVRLTAERWRLPGDLKAIRDDLEQHRAGGAPDDILILDSIQQHLTRPYWHEPCAETMTGLVGIAVDFDMAVVLIGHTTKGKHASVEAMIAGATVLQNLSKGIFVFGPEPGAQLREMQAEASDRTLGNPRYVLACERLGIAPKPVSMAFEQRTQPNPVTRREEPYLTYLGPSQFTAREVLDEAKTDDRGGRDASKSAQAAHWIVETLLTNGPMTTDDFVAKAQADGVYGSRNTFDRARKIARVRSYKDGSVWWVVLKEATPPPAPDEEHGGDETGTTSATPPANQDAEHGGDETGRARTRRRRARQPPTPPPPPSRKYGGDEKASARAYPSPRRNQLLDYLRAHPGATGHQIAEAIGMDPSNCGKQLKELQHAGLVRAQRQGRANCWYAGESQ